jgi:hypothetical protein
MTEAEPNTEWHGGCLELDNKGFIRTGLETSEGREQSAYATASRAFSQWGTY